MRVRATSKALVVGVLLTVLTAPGVSRAGVERSSRDPNAPPEQVMAEHAEQLGLAPETLTAIRTIVEASRGPQETRRVALRQAYAQMRALLSQEVPNEAAVMRQVEAISALELAARKQRLQVMLRIRALLTPAQRQELVRLQEAWQTRRRPDILQACQTESTGICSDAAQGRPHLACLHDHMAELSEACRSALQGRRGDGRGP
jgi:Spy/CpxP family protein refolding chaperone